MLSYHFEVQWSRPKHRRPHTTSDSPPLTTLKQVQTRWKAEECPTDLLAYRQLASARSLSLAKARLWLHLPVIWALHRKDVGGAGKSEHVWVNELQQVQTRLKAEAADNEQQQVERRIFASAVLSGSVTRLDLFSAITAVDYANVGVISTLVCEI